MSYVSSISQFLKENFIVTALVLLIALFGIATDNFFSPTTLQVILNQLPPLTVIAVGMTLVLIVGGIDLSVGSLMALSAAIIGTLTVTAELPFALSALFGLAGAGLVGFVTGWLNAALRLPAFIITLGILEAARGGAYLISGSQTVYIGPSIQWLSAPVAYVDISPAALLAALVVITAHITLNYSVFGRKLIATGTNETAAHISGINPVPIKIIVFTVSGLLAGLAGLFNASYLASADPNAGMGIELSAIAAAVIGGTSLMGGKGSIIGTFLGVLVIAVLESGLAQLGVSEPAKRIVTGLVIVLAVLIDRWRSE